MALSLNIQKSVLPHRTFYHLAVTWKNATLIWNGINTINYDGHLVKSNTVNHHHRGKWTTFETSGDFPKRGIMEIYEGAHVINDKMFVLNEGNGLIVVHSLDLHSWKWEKLIPAGGTVPSVANQGVRSWVYDGKINVLGGNDFSQMSIQLVCFNIATSSWEWPKQSGDVPSPRTYPLVTISSDTLFLIGGFSFETSNPREGGSYNDLHLLDMPNMMWKRVHGNVPNGQGPKRCCSPGYTFTTICHSTAAMIGTYYDSDSDILNDDCWLLNLHKAKKLMDPSSIWTKISNPCLVRDSHAAVLQPLSKRLWLIGGFNEKGPARNILKLDFNQLRPLKDLAMDCVARNICAHDPRLAPDDQMTRQLRAEIEAYRCEIGDQSGCPDEDWRKSACPLENKGIKSCGSPRVWSVGPLNPIP